MVTDFFVKFELKERGLCTRSFDVYIYIYVCVYYIYLYIYDHISIHHARILRTSSLPLSCFLLD